MASFQARLDLTQVNTVSCMATLVDAASLLPNLIDKSPAVNPPGDLLILPPDAQNQLIKALRQQHEDIQYNLPAREREDSLFNLFAPPQPTPGREIIPGEYLPSSTGEGKLYGGVRWTNGI